MHPIVEFIHSMRGVTQLHLGILQVCADSAAVIDPSHHHMVMTVMCMSCEFAGVE